MLRLSSSLFNRPVMSLRLGGQIATAVEPIINPHNLKIVGWWCKVPGKTEREVLLADQLRQVMPNGLAVNDVDDLTEPQDLVRHKEILEINYALKDKPVRTKRSKVGKVEDYSYNDGLFVQKLYVTRPLVKALVAQPTVLIDRTQILEVNDNYILVKDTEVLEGAEEPSAAPAPA